MITRMELAELLAGRDEQDRPWVPGVAALLDLIESDEGVWPKEHEKELLKTLNTYVAFRESDKAALARVAGKTGKDAEAKYRVDALPDRISDAWAHYLFGDPGTVQAAAAGDQALLDALVPDTFDGDLEGGAAICSSEGEVWPRCYVDEDAGTVETDFLSRLDVLPWFVGRRLAAAAVWTDLPKPSKTSKEQFRHFEIHETGVVVNVLFKGSASNVGTRVPLDAHAATAGLEEVWRHDLPFMLIDRIPNRIRSRRGARGQVGRSDYAAVVDQFLDLNESMATGARNMRLSAKQRAVISQAAAAAGRRQVGVPGYSDLEPGVDEGGTSRANGPKFDPDEEVFVDDPLDAELGGSGKQPFTVLSYSFDSGPLVAWRNELVNVALSRVGLSGQYVGLGDTAGVQYAISGTALRLKLIPTNATGKAKARYWDAAVPLILQRMAALASLPADEGGLGQSWANVADPPTYTRRPGIPVDPLEEAQRIQALTAARVQSVRQSVIELHPDWDVTAVDAELARLNDAAAAQADTIPTFGA